MSSTAGSTMQSADRVTRAAVVLHGRPDALGSGLERLEAVAAAAGRGARDDRRRRGRCRRPTSRSRSCSAATGRCCGRCTAFLGTGIPVIGVNFGRVGFLSAIPRDELESGVARVFAGELEPVELTTLEVETERKAARRRERRRRDERRARPHGRARVVDRRRGLRPRALRRSDLLDAVGLDRLQPLERRAGADVGARRDGADLRRSTRPPRAAVRPAAWPRPPRSGTARPTSAVPCSSTATGSAMRARTSRSRSASASSDRCSGRCRRRRSCGATGRASAAP